MKNHELPVRQQAHLASQILPITALAHLRHGIVLVGEGGVLCLYGDSSTQLASRRIFEQQAIHGIVHDPISDQILVFGGRHIKIVRVHIVDGDQCSYHIDELTPQLSAEDWVLDALFVDSSASLVTAHNALVELNTSVSTLQFNTVIPGSNTILYSAHIVEGENKERIVAAGTAFGDVLIWSLSTSSAGVVKATTHYSFSAHEGSTFGVRISPALHPALPLGETRLLASCSDDRTVRVWDISNLTGSVASETNDNRSTGFGVDGTILAANTDSPPLLARVMGHVSRIWHVLFDLTPTLTSVKSFGEDATTITWVLEQSSGAATPYRLTQTNVISANSGKHLWAVAANSDGSVVVGGADGAVAKMTDRSKRHDLVLDCSKLSHAEDPLQKDIIKTYRWIDEHTLFVITQQGVLAVIDMSNGAPTCRHTFHQPELANFSVVATTSQAAFAVGPRGSVFCYLMGSAQLQPLEQDAGKLIYLGAHEVSLGTKQQRLTALLMQEVTRDHICLKLIDRQGGTPVCIQALTCHMPRDSVVTCSTYTELPQSRHALVLGLRNGSLLLFVLELDEPVHVLTEPDLAAALHTEAVTALQWLPSPGDNECHLGHILSTGRDGTYAVHMISMHESGMRIITVHRLEVSLGASLEGFSLTAENDLLVYGFRSKHLVVATVTSHRELFKVDCGGAHRSWSIIPEVNRMSFVWTKASSTYLRLSRQPDFALTKPGGHGREIKSTAVHKGHDTAIIATGAQDTDIRLWQINEHSSSPKCLHVLRQHNTGPQHLRFSDDGEYLFSSGGFEEFFVWKINKQCPILGIGVVCESVHPRTGTSDLRITGFDVRRIHNDQDSSHWRIAMAYSDSRIGLWTYSPGGWQKLMEADYLTACPTSIWSLPADFDDSTYVTLATDGCLALWNNHIGHEQKLAWSTRRQLHQNAILSSCHHKLASNYHLFVTGGDDNAIAFSILSTDERTPLLWHSIADAHAAAVTALYCWASQRAGSLYVLSAGLDQRVILWQVLFDDCRPHGLIVRKIEIIYSAVADICSIESLFEPTDRCIHILVSGVGMEHWTISIPS